MSYYASFALSYDRLMQDVDYEKRAEYILSLFEKHKKKPIDVIDLGCGTCNLSFALMKKGVDVIGVDNSPLMLTEARNKAYDLGLSPLLLCQDISELDLYGTAEGAISTLDCLNHITDIKKLEKVFERLKFFIEPGGLFIFDVNTPYKHKEILSGATFVRDMDEVYCVWQNGVCDDELKVSISLDIFTKEEDGLYSLSSETFVERAYTEKQLSEIFKRNCFEQVAVYEDMSLDAPKDTTQRMVFVLKRK